MGRALFAAIGAFVLLVGLQLACCEKVIWRYKTDVGGFSFTRAQSAEFVPIDHHPWAYITAGTVICIYSYTLRRGK